MLLFSGIENNISDKKNFQIIIQFSFLCLLFFLLNNSSLYTKTKEEIKSLHLRKIINKLKMYSKYRQPKYYLFSDFFGNKYCSDINAFVLFEYYLKNNNNDVFYIINNDSELYQNLKKENRTKNLILINGKINILDKLFNYILNAKIIIQSYVLLDFHYIVNNVTYLKYIYINHGITYFKNHFVSSELNYLNEDKRNIITSSPYEYNIYINNFNYSDKYIYKAGLARYEMYRSIKKGNKEKNCILASFTYRSYNNSYYEKSLYKSNLMKLLNDNSLIKFLKSYNIDLIYIPHHYELYLHKKFNSTKYIYAKIFGQNDLTSYIQKCSLLITDFSSISFAFMFNYKPILFYLLDYNETIDVPEIKWMNPNNELFFGNSFLNKDSLVKKIKYYVRRKFKISKTLKNNYKSVFYYRKNIRKRLCEIINKIVNT